VNIKEYISSGILESYVLGELSADETREVDVNLVRYPELREELSLVEQAQEKLLLKVAVMPRTSLKQEVFERIPAEKSVKQVSLNDNSQFWKFAAAASIAVAIVSSILAYNYWNKLRSTETDLVALREQNARIAEDYNQVNQKLGDFEKELAIISDPAFVKIAMNGTANAPDANALVYWNESTSEVYLKIKNLKTLAQENQYQLWAIIDGKPVNAGVFDGNIAGLVRMKEIAKGASAFAVTIEPRGGKPAPSLETMQVSGTVKKS
jgi:anti-sigma-K factor RskA